MSKPGFCGDFEMHITFSIDQTQVKDLMDWAKKHAMKYHCIHLARGQHVYQPMVTRHGKGTLATEKAVADVLFTQLSLAGFQPSRIKIEASCGNDEVPQCDRTAQLLPECYFESHIKLLLPNSFDRKVLEDLVIPYCGHLSRSSLAVYSNGDTEHFVTQRCHDHGLPTAMMALTGLLCELINFDYRLIKVEREYVVYDSNLDLDKGWLVV